MTTDYDIKHTLRGKKISHGASRSVYECRLRKDLVVKIETKGQSFSNATEWQIWQEAEYYGITEWLAPCEFISPSGIVLIQKKTTPAPLDFVYPIEIPAFFADIKKENFGLLEGRLVCHDYGNHHCFRLALQNKKLQKVEWC